MLRRIQTVYLFLALVLLIAGTVFLGLDLLQIYTENKIYQGNLLKITEEVLNIILFCFSMFSTIGILVNIISIFLFKKRGLQIKLGKLLIGINILLLGLSFYILLSSSGDFSEKDVLVVISYFASVVLLFLAVRAIKKDENLVKSVDRLR